MDTAETKQIVETLLSRLGIDVEEMKERDDDGHLQLSVRTQGAGEFVGEHGEGLWALEHIAKRIIERHDKHAASVLRIDVDGFYEKRADEIRNHAKLLAARARMFQYDVEMPPMNAYERLLVHAALADEEGVATQSYGVGKLRRVVIKFVADGSTRDESPSKNTSV